MFPPACVRRSRPAWGSHLWCLLLLALGKALPTNRAFHNNNGGPLKNHALTNGCLNTLYFFMFNKCYRCIAFLHVFKPSHEILFFCYVSYGAFWHHFLQRTFVRIRILAQRLLHILKISSWCSMGSVLFCWSPCCVGMRILLFSTPLLWDCSKNRFPENVQMILQMLQFELSMRASLFWMVLTNVIPTERGDRMVKVNSRGRNRCDAEMIKYHRET